MTQQDQIRQHIHNLTTLLAISADPVFQPWSNRPQLSGNRARGVYIIFDQHRVLYVGKGQILDRQSRHREKFLGEFRNARDTRGFRLFREQHGVIDLNSLEFCSIELEQESAISAVEGGLIHLLRPLANDEIAVQPQVRG